MEEAHGPSLLERLLNEIAMSARAAEETALGPPGLAVGGVEDIDLVISGGGLKGYFANGVCHVLRQSRRFNVRRVAGCSAGAWAGAFMCLNLNSREWADTYNNTQLHMGLGKQLPDEDGNERPERHLMDAYRCFTDSVFPDDVHKVCTGRLHVSITVMDGLIPRNVLVSQFDSKQELIDCLVASGTIPYISIGTAYSKVVGKFGPRTMCLDGGITVNTPVFTDAVRRQVVVELSQVDYQGGLSVRFSPRMWCANLALVDRSIEDLCIKGAMDCRQALAMDAARRAVALGVREDDLGIGLPSEVGVLSPCPTELLSITIRGELDEQGALVGGRNAPTRSPAVGPATPKKHPNGKVAAGVALLGRLLVNTPWLIWTVSRFLVVGTLSAARAVLASIILTIWRLIARRSAKPVSQHIRWSSDSGLRRKAAAGWGAAGRGTGLTGAAKGMVRPMSHPALSTIREEDERRPPSKA
jgi:hypothetical protein